MTFALSTNWCARRMASGEAIADAAAELGFDALELGFSTAREQVAGFKARLDRMPVGSVHAFCPVPLSAPQGHPELYLLADPDEAARALARVHVRKTVEFAAEMGAGAVVLHAGRVRCRGFPARWDLRRRVRRGRRLVDAFRRELEALLPVLEASKVVLGLENLPYLEGFPAEWELADVCGEWVRPWLDTGHDFVRETSGWKLPPAADGAPPPVGLHVNDSVGGDDHLPPGEGKIDFSALKETARGAQHVVLEPREDVSPERLAAGLAFIKGLWDP